MQPHKHVHASLITLVNVQVWAVRLLLHAQDVGTSQDVATALGTSGTPAESESANGTGLQIAVPNSTYTASTKELSITGQ